jgi:hypothetical protein
MSLSRRSLLATLAAASLLRAIEPSKLKIAITTDEVDEDLGVALQFLARHGLKWAEIRNLGDKYNTSQPPEIVREARKQLDGAGVKLAILDTGFFKVPLPESHECRHSRHGPDPHLCVHLRQGREARQGGLSPHL